MLLANCGRVPVVESWDLSHSKHGRTLALISRASCGNGRHDQRPVPRGIAARSGRRLQTGTRLPPYHHQHPLWSERLPACPRRTDWTISPARPRHSKVRPKEQPLGPTGAADVSTPPAFKALYDSQAGVEGTLSQRPRVCNLHYASTSGWLRSAYST
jgi:hypothetical protein